MDIIIDMDDICVELLEPWLNVLNKKSKYHREEVDIVNWDIRLAYPDLTSFQIYTPLYDVELWKNVRPVKGAYECMQRLMQEGHRIYIATASYPQNFGIKTEECLFKIFKFIKHEDVICIHNKSLLKGHIMFDDYHENLKNFEGLRVLRTKPYNINCSDDCFDIRTSNENCWEEFYKIVKELEKIVEGT